MKDETGDGVAGGAAGGDVEEAEARDEPCRFAGLGGDAAGGEPAAGVDETGGVGGGGAGFDEGATVFGGEVRRCGEEIGFGS